MPLLLLGISLDDQGTPVEYFSTWHRADRVVFDLDVIGDQPAAAAPSNTALSNAALAGPVQELARELQSLSEHLK